MPRYKSKNSVTGETVSFDWTGKNPPTEDDINRIADEQRTARLAIKQKAVDAEPSFTQRLVEGAKTGMANEPWYMKPVGALAGAAAGLTYDNVGPGLTEATKLAGLDQPWSPMQGVSDIKQGVGKMIQGIGPEEYPRIAGAGQAIRGAFGVGGPPLTAMGMALAPEVTLPAMVAGNVASRGTGALLEGSVSPEVNELASTGAGLVAGGLAGHYAPRMLPQVPPPPAIPPTETALGRPIYGAREGPQRTGVTVEHPPQGPPQLPQGPPIARNTQSSAPPPGAPPSGPYPMGPPATQLPPAIPDVQPVMPRYQPLPSAGQQLQLPEVSPIQMPDTRFQMPPAGSAEMNPPVQQALPGPSINQRALPAPEIPEVQQPSSAPRQETPPVAAGQEVQPPKAEPPASPAPAPPQVPPVAPFENTMMPKPIKGSSSMSPSLRNVGPINKAPEVRSAPEQMPEPTPMEKPEPVKTSPQREQRITQLKSMIDDADKEGDNFQSETFKKTLEQEEQRAEIERTGTPEQKAVLKTIDDSTSRVQEIEAKEDSGAELSPDEIQELKKLYQKINAAEIQHFFGSEEGSSPSVGRRPGDESGRSFLGRLAYSTKNVVPGPGMADIRGLSASISSPHRILQESNLPGAREIGIGTPKVEVMKSKFIGTKLRDAVPFLKGLSLEERQLASDIVENKATSTDPRINKAAQGIKQWFDGIHKQFGPTKSGKPVGKISDYITHLAAKFEGDNWFENTANDVANAHLSPLLSGMNLITRTPVEGKLGSVSPLEQRGVGMSDPSIVKTRTGQRWEYERDPLKYMPAYVEMAGKFIYDKPWIDKARGYLAQIPEDAKTAKAMATDYLRNYANTSDGYENIRSKWGQFTGSLMRAQSRAVLGLSSRLFTLHTSRLLSNIFPEIPIKYFAKGAMKAMSDPMGTFDDLGRRGVLPSNTTPWLFKDYAGKMDSVLQAGGTFDAIPDAVGWHGFNEMYLDKGYDKVTAGNMASDRIMDLSMRSTPARMQRLFDIDGPMRPFLQYKQQVMKIAEQYLTQIPKAIKGSVTGDEKIENAGKVLRYIFGVGSMLYLHKKVGVSTFHLNPLTLGEVGTGGVPGTALRVIRLAAAGHYDKALAEAGLMFVPAQREIGGVLKGKGLSMFEHGRKPSQSVDPFGNTSDMDRLPELP